VERINAFFGYRAVAELRIVQGHVQTPEKPVALPLPAVRRPAAPAVPLPGLAEVRDEALREALARMQKGVARRAAQ
jgi:hypothetical protein